MRSREPAEQRGVGPPTSASTASSPRTPRAGNYRSTTSPASPVRRRPPRLRAARAAEQRRASSYRIGGGQLGNVNAKPLTSLGAALAYIDSVVNPLPRRAAPIARPSTRRRTARRTRSEPRPRGHRGGTTILSAAGSRQSHGFRAFGSSRADSALLGAWLRTVQRVGVLSNPRRIAIVDDEDVHFRSRISGSRRADATGHRMLAVARALRSCSTRQGRCSRRSASSSGLSSPVTLVRSTSSQTDHRRSVVDSVFRTHLAVVLS